MITRRQFVEGLLALGLGLRAIDMLVGAEPAAAQASPVRAARYLVLIVMDAFRPDYLSLDHMPALRALTRSGTSYDRAWVGQLQSETPTGHATIASGSTPNHTGIIGFEWRNPKTGKEVLDGWPPGVLAGLMERDLRAAGAPSIPLAVKAADPAAKIVALSSEKIYAAAAMGGWAADYILFHQRNSDRTSLAPAGIRGHVPPDEFLALGSLRSRYPVRHFTDWDYLSGMLALESVKSFRPRALMVNLPSADVYGHRYGGPASPAVMAQIASGIDRTIQRIVSAYKDAGIFADTLFVVTADHGMVPNARAVDGTTVKSAVRSSGAQYLFHTGGTAADIYLRDQRKSPAVAATMSRIPNVEASYYQVNTNGKYEYVPASGSTIERSLEEAHRYLLGTFAGPVAPDVFSAFRENTIGRQFNHAAGDHGGVNWHAQAVPLVLAGPGIRAGSISHFPARLADIAPTVLRILGLTSARMDGEVLADALEQSSATEVAAQDKQAPVLAAHQDALIERSLSNEREDAKLHIKPPPTLPAVP